MSSIKTIHVQPFFSDKDTILQELIRIITHLRENGTDLPELDRPVPMSLIQSILDDTTGNKLLIFEMEHSLKDIYDAWQRDIFEPSQIGRPFIWLDGKNYKMALAGYFPEGSDKAGELSFFGCGYNVLAFLGLISIDEAQNLIQQMNNSNNNDGAGLSTESMIQVIESKYRISLQRYFFQWSDSTNEFTKLCKVIITVLIIIFTLQSLDTPNKCIMVKQIRNIVTGEGHTVLYAIHDDKLFMIDPQMGKFKEFTGRGIFLLLSHYQGIDLQVFTAPPPMHEGGSKRSKRKTRKNNKSMESKDGVNKIPFGIETHNIHEIKHEEDLTDKEINEILKNIQKDGKKLLKK